MPWYQPNSNFLESYALRNAIDPQASAFKQITQVLANPVGTALGAGAGYLADKNQERNMEMQDYFSKNNIPYKSDMQGNIVPMNGGGLLSSLFGAGGVTGAGGVGGLLGSLFDGNGPSMMSDARHGGFVRSGDGSIVRSGDGGFVSYGDGRQGNLEAFGDNPMGTI